MIENDRPPEDVYKALLHRATYIPRPPKRKPRFRFTNPEVIIKATKRLKERRRARVLEGLCPECGKVPEEGRWCNPCKEKAAARNRRCRT